MKTISSFKSIFDKAAYGNNYAKTFEDFLSMCLCAFSRNLETGLSYYEDEYLKIIVPYKDNGTLKYFPELLGEMVNYMEENKDNSQGNDLLGEFFQQEISRGKMGQFFTPFHVCSMMAQMNMTDDSRPVRVLDPACGSGRMLMAHAKNSTIRNFYYGMDLDPMCVRMTALNMFLNGIRGEVICADALMPHDFRFGYRISFLPLGIFKIDEKENSTIWQSNHTNFSSKIEKPESEKSRNGQLTLF